MHKISHLVEVRSIVARLFEYPIGGQLLGVTAHQHQLFLPCKAINCVIYIYIYIYKYILCKYKNMNLLTEHDIEFS